jgi:hypothetical protein
LLVWTSQTALHRFLQYEKISPSLRVASKNSVCGVANLDNGMTIARDSRLAAIFFC